MKTRILLADDHQMMRQGLRAFLNGQPGLEVVGEAPNGRAAVECAQKLAPHVVVMDVVMPELNGVEATRQILEKAPGIKVIALSMYGERRFVAQMLEAGASGYVLKDCAIEELAQAIREVTAGRAYLSPQIAGVVVNDIMKGNRQAEPRLTAREREVLQLVAEGHSTQRIAVALSVSAKTIETHRAKIMSKLHIRSVAGLTKYAVRMGITSLDE